MKLKIKPVHPDFKIPTYGTEKAACFDMYAPEDFLVLARSSATLDLGFKVELPPGYFMEVRPRSGMATKYSVTVMNSPGTVDEDYRGNVLVCLFNSGPTNYHVKKGDRVGQAMLRRYEHAEFEIAEELSETVRGEGGMGSTGR